MVFLLGTGENRVRLSYRPDHAGKVKSLQKRALVLVAT